MIPLTKPAFTTRIVFDKCLEKIKKPDLKRNFQSCISVIVQESDLLEDKIQKNTVFTILRNPNVSALIEKKDMVWLYENALSKKGRPARAIYDKIKNSAPDGICPLCSLRYVDTLDHYLPKTLYPVFSVTPINLIPACTPCNIGKKIKFPLSDVDQTLHPYYDNVNNINWISAKVLQSNPVSVTFYASPPPEWDPVLQKKVIHHFESYNLNDVFSANGNRRLYGDLSFLKKQSNINTAALKKHLMESHESNLSLGVNSVEAVLFKTLHDDDWFCTTGINW
jgi:5-methylcytosine-specific restriction endonuclease McrA